MGAVSSLTSFATANVYIRRSTSCFRRSPHERVAKAVRLSLGGVDCPAGEKLAAVPTVAAARVGLGIVNKTTATSLCDALYTANALYTGKTRSSAPSRLYFLSSLHLPFHGSANDGLLSFGGVT